MKMIKLTDKQLRFLLYALRGYKIKLGINKVGDLFFSKMFEDFSNDIEECVKLEKQLFKKIISKVKRR